MTRRLRKFGVMFLALTSTLLVSLHVLARYGPNDMFTLRDVVVEGNLYATEAEIFDLCGVRPGENLFEIDLDRIASAVRRHPWVAAVSVTRVPPSTLKIHVSERRPVAFVAAGELYLLDETGVLLENRRPDLVTDLPLVTGLAVTEKDLGGRLSGPKTTRILQALRLLRSRYRQLFARVSEVSWIEGKGVVATLVGNATQIILGLEDFGNRLERTALVLRYLDHYGRLDTFRYLDTRFSGQIVARQRT